MKRNEAIWISATSLVFILTGYLLKDLFSATGFALLGLIGAFSGLFAFWWGFKFIRNRSVSQQILFTAVYCIAILTIAFLFVRNRDDSENISVSVLSGNWLSPSSNDNDPDLVLEFKKHDSLYVFVNDQEFHYSFEIENNHLLIKHEGDIKFDWLINRLDSKTLVIGDGDQTVMFKKIAE